MARVKRTPRTGGWKTERGSARVIARRFQAPHALHRWVRHAVAGGKSAEGNHGTPWRRLRYSELPCGWPKKSSEAPPGGVGVALTDTAPILPRNLSTKGSRPAGSVARGGVPDGKSRCQAAEDAGATVQPPKASTVADTESRDGRGHRKPRQTRTPKAATSADTESLDGRGHRKLQQTRSCQSSPPASPAVRS